MKYQAGFWLIMFLVFKLLLDFFSPVRDVNFLVTSSMAALFLMITPIRLDLLKATRNISLLFILFLFLMLLNKPSPIYFTKFISYLVFFLIFLNVGWRLSDPEIRMVSRSYWFAVIVVFFTSFLISLGIGHKPGARNFFINFDFVGTVGTYFISALIFVAYLNYKRFSHIRSLVVVLMGYLTFSTGSFVSTLLIYFKPFKLRVKEVMIYSITLIVISIVFIYSVQKLNPELYQKLFGPFLLFFRGGYNLNEFVRFAIQNERIQNIEDAYQGSMLWRFYAYAVYINYIFSQDVLVFLLGSGYGGFDAVMWGKFPHNDFILVFTEYGLIGLIVFVALLWRILKWIIQSNEMFLGIMIMFLLRLFFANTINSNFVISNFVIIASVMLGTHLRQVHIRNEQARLSA